MADEFSRQELAAMNHQAEKMLDRAMQENNTNATHSPREYRENQLDSIKSLVADDPKYLDTLVENYKRDYSKEPNNMNLSSSRASSPISNLDRTELLELDSIKDQLKDTGVHECDSSAISQPPQDPSQTKSCERH